MRADVEHGLEEQHSRRRARERVLTALVAFALGVGSFVFAARAFLGPSSTSRPTANPVAPSVASGLLAFPAVPAGIYSMNPDGTGISNLTGTYDPRVVVAAYGPRWSPDGTRIAFYGYSAGGVDDYNGGANYDVYIMKADGTGVTNLTTTPGDIATEFSQGSPTWSPDGTRIAYDGDVGLYVMNADGSDQTRIASGQRSSWSPDGTRIAFEGPGGAIWSAAPDGSGLAQLTGGDGDVFPTYSPDGTKIAYCHCHDSTMAIHVMNADGSGQMVVADLQAHDLGRPAWSPDGTRLIFEALVSVSPGTDGHPDFNYDIYSVNADGSGLADLTPTTGRTENSPVWAPEGTKIAFEASTTLNGENAGTSDIYVMNPDGTGEQRLTTDEHAGGGDLAWQAVTVATPEATGTPATETTAQVHARVVTTIDVGQAGQVSSLLAADGSIWVAGAESVGTGWVKRIDPATNEVVATIHLEAAPGWDFGGGGIAAGAGSIWVTGPGRGPGAVLERINPSTNRVVAAIPLDGQEGADVTVDDSGVWVLVFDTSTSMKVLRVDPATNQVVATIPIDSDFSRRVAAADGAIWVEEHRSQDAVGNGSYLAKIDPATNQVVATLPNGSFGAFDPDQDVIWIATGYALARIDPETAQFIGDSMPVGSAIRGFGLAAGEGGVWFFGYDDTVDGAPSFLERFNSMTEEIDASPELPNPGPVALALAPGSIWTVNRDGSVTRIDLS